MMANTNRRLDSNDLLYYLLMLVVMGSYSLSLYLVLTVFFAGENSGVESLFSLAAFMIVALTLIPVWKWLQPRVHHVIYTMDESQVEMIEYLSHSLISTSADPFILSTIPESIAHTVKLPYVQLETVIGETITYGTPIEEGARTRIEISYDKETVGWLEVTSRLPKELLTKNEHLLLNSLARQVGITLHAIQMSNMLQESREQIIVAREEERRRIRNDLHDGLAPSLSSFQLQLSAIRTFMKQNPAEAEKMIEELSEDMRQATAEIRRLVYDLRPPMLDDLGLVAAIKHIKLPGSLLRLEVIAPDPLPSLPAAAEVAVYRIASEAVHNVVKHAQATCCMVAIDVEATTLVLNVSDDGRSPAISPPGGIGIQSMQERTAELGGTFSIHAGEGGGTRVEVRLPLEMA